MDISLRDLNIEEEDDVPFKMPNLPEFCYSEKNKLSLVGRILNPRSQKMTSLILDMPRKWQKQGRVHGVALTKEKFQFFFDNERDMEDVLNKGVQTFNEWAIAMEKWIANPDEEYLNYVSIWVQIRNFPMSYFTVPAITAIGELLGQVVEVMYDPKKPMTKEFVRVKIKIHVAQPLRQSKTIKLPHGELVKVFFNYERVQKRCYACQRLTHEKDFCPFTAPNSNLSDPGKAKESASVSKKIVLKPDDPLFGVLTEEQIGINAITGQPKITNEVLDHLRIMLLAAPPEKLLVEQEMIRRVVKEAEQNAISQHMFLNMLPFPKVTMEIDKGKGIDIGSDSKEENLQLIKVGLPAKKLMADAMGDKNPISRKGDPPYSQMILPIIREEQDGASQQNKLPSNTPKTFKRLSLKKTGLSENQSSSLLIKNKDNPQAYNLDEVGNNQSRRSEGSIGLKRKETEEEETSQTGSKRLKKEVVPKEGPPAV